MVNWSQIDKVLLDMDGTLLDLHFDNYFWLEHLPARYAAHHKMTLEDAVSSLTEQMRRKTGQLEWYCLDYWSELTGLPIAAMKVDIEHKIQYRPSVKTFLNALKNSDKRAVIVTNAHRDSVDLKMRKTALDTLVDRVISSHDYQEPKESQLFWQHLQADENFDPQRTLLIDDSLAVLASAQRFGIAHLLCIHQPDSQQPHRNIEQFPAVDLFDEILPIQGQ